MPGIKLFMLRNTTFYWRRLWSTEVSFIAFQNIWGQFLNTLSIYGSQSEPEMWK
jgi:hypothetical protein